MDLLKRQRRHARDRTRPAGRMGPSDEYRQPRDRLTGPMPEPEASDTARYDQGERYDRGGGTATVAGASPAGGAGVAEPGTTRAEPVERIERPEDERLAERERPEGPEPVRYGRGERREVVEEETVTPRWSVADAIVALTGLALAVAGIIALLQAGLDRQWFEPVEEVIGADHTPLLGALELGAGVLLILAGVFRQRALATLLGLAIVAFAVFALVQNDDVQRELAIEDWWSWVLGGLGLLAVLMSLMRRKGRIERVIRPSE